MTADENMAPAGKEDSGMLQRVVDFFALTFRGRAVLLLVPIVVAMSLVYTLDAIYVQQKMIRNELIKKGEMIALIAARNAELPILSENNEQMTKAAHALLDIRDIAFMEFYNKGLKQLAHDGQKSGTRLVVPADAEPEIITAESADFFEFAAPVYTVRAKGELDLFNMGTQSSSSRELVGWVRVGLSKKPVTAAQGEIMFRGTVLATVFTIAGIILVYLFVSYATRPLLALIAATKDLRKGRDSAEIPVHSRGELGKLTHEFNRMSREIREREERIRTSEHRLRAIFERVEHAIFRIDHEGHILLANDKFEEICGRVRNIGDIFKSGAGQLLRRAAFGVIRNSEEQVIARDGLEAVVMMSIYPEVDSEGVTTGYDGYFMDITDKKRLEETLLQAQKMESVGLLAGGIAHDFNNILTGVLGYASLMKAELKEDAKLYKYADIMEKSAVRAAGLTQQLLGFARKGKYKVEKFSVNEVIKELVPFLRETLDRRIDIGLDIQPGLPPISGDSTQIYQALLNCCINARDAMPDGGKLYLRTEHCLLADEKVLDFFKVPAGEYVRVNITDTGMGMSAEVKRRIFEPFFTTKAVGKGTGLGLAMVYGIVKSHSGYLNVYSEPGLGTTIRMYLPAVSGEVEDKKEVARVKERASKGTILLVDDEEVVRELGKEILEAYDYKVRLATNGGEGVSVYVQHKDEIDLVILDMVMPVKNGKQVFREMRAINPDVRVIISSGYGQDEYFQEMFDSGVLGFLQKPFQHHDLIGKVEECMNK